jgi:hypothetical protein
MLRHTVVGLLGSVLLLGCVDRGKSPSVPVVQIAVKPVAGGGVAVAGGPSSSSHSLLDARGPGDEIDVQWHGSWWPAVILDRRGQRWLVHYDGYGDDADEVVGDDRIRSRRTKLEPVPDDADFDADP